MPVSASDNKALEEMLRANALPKMNVMLFNILKLLGKREKESFTPHDLSKLVDEVGEHEAEYKERVQNIKNYLNHLNISEIVTPVKKITEFLEGDLLATDSKFLGTIVTQHGRTDLEHKKVTNTPEKGKTAWLKIVLVVLIVGLIGFMAWYLYDSGALNNLIPSLPTFGASQPDIMKKYNTPEKLKAAIDRGEVDYNSLPPDIKNMVDTVKTPTVEPNQ